jgi:hypothetical protein
MMVYFGEPEVFEWQIFEPVTSGIRRHSAALDRFHQLAQLLPVHAQPSFKE